MPVPYLEFGYRLFKANGLYGTLLLLESLSDIFRVTPLLGANWVLFLAGYRLQGRLGAFLAGYYLFSGKRVVVSLCVGLLGLKVFSNFIMLRNDVI